MDASAPYALDASAAIRGVELCEDDVGDGRRGRGLVWSGCKGRREASRLEPPRHPSFQNPDDAELVPDS